MTKGSKKAEANATPADFLAEEIDIVSKMTPEEVMALESQYVEKDFLVKFLFCGPTRRVNRLREGEEKTFYVYADQFRLGLNFPLCSEFSEVLKHYGVVLAQLVPNSVASIMSFILYLRRFQRPWSLELFHQHFYCRILAGGYVQFSTTAALKIEGTANKVRDWKLYFCRVDAAAEVDIPRKPSENRFEKIDKSLVGKGTLIIDVRQYVKDKKVLKKLLYPDIHIAMTPADWVASDETLRLLLERSVQLEKKKKDKPAHKKSPMRKFLEGPAVEGSAGGRAVTADLPSTSRARDEQSAEEHSPEDEPQESNEEPPIKRQRIEKGKKPIEEAPASTSRVIIAEDGHTATVDMTKEWFPSKLVPVGVASSMASVLYSHNLERHMHSLSLSQLRDRASRHQAAAWAMSEFLGGELQLARNLEQELKSQITSLKIKNGRLEVRDKDWGERFSVAAEEHEEIIEQLKATHANALAEAEERVIGESLRQHKEELEELRAQNRQLREKNEYLEDSALRENRNGIALCLDRLYKYEALTDPKWNSVEAIEELISDVESDGASTNV